MTACVVPPSVNALGGSVSVGPLFSTEAALIAKRDELRKLLRQLEGGLEVMQILDEVQTNGRA